MIFYSVMPYERVFCAEKPNATVMCRRMEVYDGAEVEVSEMPDGGRRIERLYSTNPAYYLDKRFSPGRTVYTNRV